MMELVKDLFAGTNPIASWQLAILIVAVVIVVVAVLLSLIIRTAHAINDEVATVWANGQRVANNTIHIASIHTTFDVVEGVLSGAARILGHSQAIQGHAESCPGCPTCIWHKEQRK